MKIQPPVRISHSYRQRLNACPVAVFPLLCPVREAEWVEEWDPRVVYTHSGYAEAGCVFVTPEEEGEAVWTITEYEPLAFRIGFVKVVPERLVVRIRIALSEDERGGCEADVHYTWTALSAQGERAVGAMTKVAFETFVREWEDALNRYLLTHPQMQVSYAPDEGANAPER